jgi:hypothetical protein
MGLWRMAIAILGLLLAIQAASGDHRAENAIAGVSDTEAFYATVKENLARAQRAAHAFSYKERRSTVHRNPFGKLGTGGVELYQVYPSANPELTYHRLLARDGVPLSERELAKQDREYRARAARVGRALQKENDNERRRREQDEAQARRRGQTIIEDVVAALQFSIVGRGEFESSPAVVVAFARRPQFRPKTREGQIAQKFAGTVWIHPELSEVMHVEAKSTDDLAFGFGVVARLNEGAIGSVTRRPVEPGLWMPTSVRLAGSGRALLFIRKLTVDYLVEWFDYQRVEPQSGADLPDLTPDAGRPVSG